MTPSPKFPSPKFPSEKGYKIYSQVVPKHMLDAVVMDIEAHTEGGKHAVAYGGLTELYHAQSMWNIRQLEEIHGIFSQILETEKLWVSIDRVCRKAPLEKNANGKYFTESFIHWDENPNEYPRQLKVQGLVALTDTTEEMGGFQCLSGFYGRLDEWIASQPNAKVSSPSFSIDLGKNTAYPNNAFYEGPYPTRDPNQKPYEPVWPDWNIEKVPMKAGDILVFDAMLPHGNGNNFSKKIRYCQYITMSKVGDERLRQERIRCWENNLPPSGWAFPGDPRRAEEKVPSAQLTRLGRRLLGLESWPVNSEFSDSAYELVSQ